MTLASHIQKGAYLWTDNHSSYNKLTESLGSKRVIVSSHEEYDKFNHLNTVNSCHSSIKEWNATGKANVIGDNSLLFEILDICHAGLNGSVPIF